MSISHEHAGPKISAKIKIYFLTRVELLCSLCYEIPCIPGSGNFFQIYLIQMTKNSVLDRVNENREGFSKLNGV